MPIFKRERRNTATDPPAATAAAARSEFTGERLLAELFGRPGTITRAEALEIPAVRGCINFIAGAVSMLPVKLYQESDGKAEEIPGDNRVRLLNDDTGDTLDAAQFWRAMLADYYLGGAGYAYIRRRGNRVEGLHYVKHGSISINHNNDPIYKDYDVFVNGVQYLPYDFLKLLRGTRDGATGQGIINENALLLSVVYNTMRFEENLVKNGGNKKGFIKSAKKLTQESMDALKTAWRNLYGNNNESTAVLNEGLDFKEISNSSVEMQLRENKEANSAEICRLFNLPPSAASGTSDAAGYAAAFKTGVQPVLRAIECALNRDLLLESEKADHYFAFDTKELLKGDIKARYEAYKTGLEANFLQIDEVRFMEDLPALGLNFLKFGLNTVLYDPVTKLLYTPNTGKYSEMGVQNLNESEETKENADRNTQ